MQKQDVRKSQIMSDIAFLQQAGAFYDQTK